VGLKQHVDEYTHKGGNKLYIVITISDLNYQHNCIVKDFLSDHRCVLFESVHEKRSTESKIIDYQNINNVPDDSWAEELSNIKLMSNSPTLMSNELTNQLMNVLNSSCKSENKKR
jgi:hypothetical protein